MCLLLNAQLKYNIRSWYNRKENQSYSLDIEEETWSGIMLKME